MNMGLIYGGSVVHVDMDIRMSFERYSMLQGTLNDHRTLKVQRDRCTTSVILKRSD